MTPRLAAVLAVLALAVGACGGGGDGAAGATDSAGETDGGADAPATAVDTGPSGACSVDEDCLGGGNGPCDALQCEDGRCVPVDGEVPCDDDDPCTVDDACANGRCVGAPRPCDDGNACTDDTCDGGECVAVPNAAGCDDGDRCTLDDVCAAGRCRGAERTCDDANPCTGDGCDPARGCVHAPLERACDDGDACTRDDRCVEAACVGEEVACEDGNACTDDSCDAAVGCIFAVHGRPCEDGIPCTVGDQCRFGLCAPGAWDEGAGDACVLGRCGDRRCGRGETCVECPADCGPCCGDGGCVVDHGETCFACPLDCGPCRACGDGACDEAAGESCDTCPDDCGACGDTCVAGEVLRCGDARSGDLIGSQTTDNLATYGCAETADVPYDGPEQAWVMVPRCDGLVRVRARRTDAGGGPMDVLVLDGEAPCRGDACVAAGRMQADGGEVGLAEAAFFGRTDRAAWLVVDGPLGEVGSFRLSVECSCAVPPEACANGRDDDLDGRADCADPECAEDPFCTGVEARCADGVDDDADGATDCDDEDCADATACRPEICRNGVDDDRDGLTDCAEPSCVGADGCPAPGGSCADALVLDALTLPLAYAASTEAASAAFAVADGACPGLRAGRGGASPDVVFTVDAPRAGRYLFSLDGALTDFNSVLAVVSDCEAPATSCLGAADRSGFGGEGVVVTLATAQRVHVIVDGSSTTQRLAGQFVLRLERLGGVEVACDDGDDGDVDGLTDCADPDCGGRGGCPLLGDDCAEAPRLDGVPQAVFTTTVGYSDGSRVDLDRCGAAGVDGMGAGAPDRVFEFRAPDSGSYVATLDPAATDFDAVLVGRTRCDNPEGGCPIGLARPGESLRFDLLLGEIVRLVVDGEANSPSAQGDFLLRIDAAP